MTSPAERAVQHVRARSTGSPVDRGLRVTINFHPEQVVAGLADTGCYVSQYVTGTSNGELTAFVGGDRWRWENRAFGGAYDEAFPYERPVYGGLDFRSGSYGAAPRFGSAYLRLAGNTLSRSTFCYPGSAHEPTAFGTADRMALVELALADQRDPLDDYVEAHVHSCVSVDADVESLVLDPSYQDTEVEEAAYRLSCAVEWHDGYRLDVDELRRHADYRGRECVDLGLEIAVDGVLTPKVIGDARDRHDQRDLKRLWHLLARFGRA